ncbi:unnamed protein product, partial [marine sediment metagenome]
EHTERSEAVQGVPLEVDDPLFTEAANILEVNGGSMTQALFFKALHGSGYHLGQASLMLRADKRFAFRGMDVSLVS